MGSAAVTIQNVDQLCDAEINGNTQFFTFRKTPSQTTATDFQTTGAEDFGLSPYWSSTELSYSQGWRQNFNPGNQYGGYKYNNNRVRAVRRVAV